MDDNFTNAPRSHASRPAKLIGIIVIIALVIAILLLSTGIVNFGNRSMFGG